MRKHRSSIKSPRIFSRLALIFILFCFVLFLVYQLFLLLFLGPVKENSKSTEVFIIEKGESTISIAKRLHNLGLVRSTFGFRLVLKLDNLGTKLQAGTYSLSPSLSTRELALSLTKGFSDLRLTIPEGFRREQIASLIESTFSLPSADFLTLTKGIEGYLFPDTYFFSPESDTQIIVDALSDNFLAKTKALSPSKEDLIIASLVERETKSDEEKPLVAGILKKRLSASWPLQLDATIQYFMGTEKEWWPNTTLLDRKLPSPYNTYLHIGLPPGPICNPGLSSIKAALEPQDSPYWFYLHDREGNIHYASTDREHEENIVKYIR